MGQLATIYAPASAPASLAELADTVRNKHECVCRAEQSMLEHASNMLEFAMEAGDALNAAKKQLAHGQWLPFLEKRCDLKERQAQNYMTLANNRAALGANPHRGADLTIKGALRRIKADKNPKSLPSPPAAQSTARAETTEIARGSPQEVKDIVESARATSERHVGFRKRARSPEQLAKHNRKRFEATICHIYQTAQTTEDMPIPETVTKKEIAGAIKELSTSRAQIGSLIERLDPSIHDRDDVGPESAGELARLNARIEELQRENHRLEIEADGLRSEIGELKAEREPHALIERALRLATPEALVGALTAKLPSASAKVEQALAALREELSDGIPEFLRRTDLAGVRECAPAPSSRGGNGA
jgi:hypothetical protein